jgi:hypothetical protein
MVVEHVLSSVLETLKWTQEQYWREQRIATAASGRPFDLRGDVTQLGVVALSVVHGRGLDDDEYPAGLAHLVESASITSVNGGREPMSAGLRLWLDRALQFDDRRSFASAIEASAELHQLLAESDSVVVPLALEAFLARLQSASDRDKLAAASTMTPVSRADRAPSTEHEPEPAQTAESLASSELPSTEPPPLEAAPGVPAPSVVPHLPGRVGNPALQSLMASDKTAADDVPFDARHAAPGGRDARVESHWRDRPLSRQAMAAAILTVVCGVGWVAASRLFADDAAPAPVAYNAPAPATLPAVPPAESSPAVTEPVPYFEAAPLPAAAPAPAAASPSTAPPVAPASTPPPAPAVGWVTVRSTHQLNVFENGALLGTSRGGRLALAPGTHQLELVNEELGYRGTQVVQVKSRAVAAVEISLPSGTLSINATPWAEVLVDGRTVGETPIGNLAISVGSHEVVFRHPELGEQRMTAVVTLSGPTRLTADMRKP